MAIVADPGADPTIARLAADRLISLCNDMAAATIVSDTLSSTSGNALARTRLLASIAGTWDVPPRIYGPVAELAQRRDPGLAAAALPAVAAFRSPQAAILLLSRTSPEQPIALRTAAFASLIQMTGRSDLGQDAAAWSAWVDRSSKLSDRDWKDVLAEGVWHEAQRSAAERAALVDRMQDGYRRLYLSLPPAPSDERTKLTVQLLQSPLPELRGLAIEILNRELAAGNTLNGLVTEAAMGLLRAPEANVRAAAARLLVQAGPTDPGALFAQALATETDPEVAAALLAGVSRWPSAEAREPALHWLEQTPEPLRGAADAILALSNAGLLKDARDRDRALQAIRRAHWNEGDPATCKLVVALGTDADRNVMVSLLRSDSPAVRAAAADALTGAPDALDAILEAATRDPSLFSSSVRAALANRPTAGAYLAIEQLPAPTDDARKAGLMQVAGELPAADLLHIASRPDTTPELRDAMLSRLTEHGAGFRRTPHIEDPAALSAAIMLLAQSRLDLKRPDLALVALDALPDSPVGISPDRVKYTRAVALLWSNRILEAGVLDAPAAAWLDGLERAVDEPHARSIAREIRTRFGKVLDSEQVTRFNQLTAKASHGKPEDDSGAQSNPAQPEGG